MKISDLEKIRKSFVRMDKLKKSDAEKVRKSFVRMEKLKISDAEKIRKSFVRMEKLKISKSFVRMEKLNKRNTTAEERVESKQKRRKELLTVKERMKNLEMFRELNKDYEDDFFASNSEPGVMRRLKCRLLPDAGDEDDLEDSSSSDVSSTSSPMPLRRYSQVLPPLPRRLTPPQYHQYLRLNTSSDDLSAR